jgi:hypothetical protein
MKISDETRSNRIKIEVLDEEDGYVPSFEIGVRIKTKSFDCCLLGFWIEKQQVQRFIAELQHLDETRKGLSILGSISPNGFTLEIKAIDGWGHLGVGIKLEKDTRSPVGYPDVLQTGFEIDPSSIPYLIKEIKNWKREHYDQ